MDKVLGYIAHGRAEGARVLTGGHRVTQRRPRPRLLRGADRVRSAAATSMAIVREEIFGPVMTVLEFDDEDEVVSARECHRVRPLGRRVHAATSTRAHRVIARLEAGTCWINHYNITPIELPFGGVKLSGLGRENGRAAIEHYTQLKSVYVAPARRSTRRTERRHGRIFDYVIVGAGSAGCVLADRLSEDGRNSVLVLEYGGSDRSIFIQMPTALSIPMNMPKYNWGYQTEPEPHLGGRRMHTPRGKVLGGSSSINGLVYVRGNPLDFERWRDEGAAGWGYA